MPTPQCKVTTPPATADQLERLGWQELGGFSLRRDHDGQVVLDGAILNRRAKLVRSSDGEGFTLLVEVEPQTGADRITSSERMREPVKISAGWTESDHAAW